MLTTDEIVLEKLVKIITDPAYDGIDTLTAIDELRSEYRNARTERQRQAFQMAMDSTYRVSLQSTDPYKPLEIIQIARRDLADFAHEKGLDEKALIEVIENRKKEVVGRGGAVWRAYPFNWIDRAPKQDYLDELASDARDLARIAATNKKAEEAREASKRVPTMSVYQKART